MLQFHDVKHLTNSFLKGKKEKFNADPKALKFAKDGNFIREFIERDVEEKKKVYDFIGNTLELKDHDENLLDQDDPNKDLQHADNNQGSWINKYTKMLLEYNYSKIPNISELEDFKIRILFPFLDFHREYFQDVKHFRKRKRGLDPIIDEYSSKLKDEKIVKK